MALLRTATEKSQRNTQGLLAAENKEKEATVYMRIASSG